MKNVNADLVHEAEKFVTKLLANKLPETIQYHTLDHSKFVVNNAEYIGKKVGLSEEEINGVKLCAWFHDTGFTKKVSKHIFILDSG
jgi:HD-GYP domain-containing protein (c-di-GMP phosphodiesterase class II)